MKVRDVGIIALIATGVVSFVWVLVWALARVDGPRATAPRHVALPGAASSADGRAEGPRVYGAKIPCKANCANVLTTCMDGGDPPDDLFAECVADCRRASPETIAACLSRDGFCGGLLPCFRGETK